MTDTSTTALTRVIGGSTVSAIGLGAMPLSVEGRPDEAQAIATVHAALDAGVTLIDTADSYHWHADEVGHNEHLIARALAAYGHGADGVLVATKGGRGRPGDGSWTVDGDPRHLRRAARASAVRLGVEAIDLYQLHKPDPAVPFAESMGALRELAEAGTVRMVGLSNVDCEQIRTAREILGQYLVSVQNRFSPAHTATRDTLDLCTDLGLTFLPWSPLGGITNAGELGAKHAVFAEIANARRVTPQVLTLAWELAKSELVIPIPGSTRPQTIMNSATASSIKLSADEIRRLDAA